MSDSINSIEQIKYETLMSELMDMRADERDCQNQILQVMSVVATVLSVLFGGGYIFGGKYGSLNSSFVAIPSPSGFFETFVTEYLTGARVIFLCNSIVLCVGITYILKLSISNMIRYYHIKDIQNKLISIRKQLGLDKEGDEFLYWDKYRMSVMTMNIRHISSVTALSHYIAYSMAIFFTLVFCFAISVIQYNTIETPQWYDKIGLGIVIITGILCMALFGYTARNSEKVGKWIRRQTITRRTIKSGIESDIAHNIKYFLYPRYTDFQKPALIIIGAVIAGAIGYKGLDSQIVLDSIVRLILSLIIFDYCAYQARFQINDIIGLSEDSKSKKNKDKRLITNDKNLRKYIWASLFIVLFRLFLAIWLLFVFKDVIFPIVAWELVALLICSFVYEFTRRIKSDWGVFLSVGLGYPLRIFVGVMCLYPDIVMSDYVSWKSIILFLGSMYFWGIFASLLSWAQDIILIANDTKPGEEKNFAKSHYAYIYRTCFAGKDLQNDPLYLRNNRGRLNEIWNIAYVCCVGCQCLIPVLIFLNTSVRGAILFEVMVFAGVLLMSFAVKSDSLKQSLIFLIIAIVIKTVIFCDLSIANIVLFIVVALMQIIIISTYFMLRYEPEMAPLSELALTAAKAIVAFIFSKRMVDVLFDKKEENEDAE